MKRLKEVLLEQYAGLQETRELSQIMTQIKVHALNLSCFVCRMTDLDGKSFKQVKKRRVVHPFPVLYNSKEMLCLEKGRHFKAYNKKEIDLETTIVKLSYIDFITLYRIVFYNLNLMKLQMYEEADFDENPSSSARPSYFDELSSRQAQSDSSL